MMEGKLIKNKFVYLFIWILLAFMCPGTQAQNLQSFISDSATIDDCIKYAMQNQPLVKQLKIDEGITNQNIRISLSDWFPRLIPLRVSSTI